MQTYDSTAEGIAHNTIYKKRTKLIDMWFYWVQDLIFQVHYNVSCKPVATNLDEYFTKHNPPHHHRRMRPLYLHCPGITNNSSARLFYSVQNNSLK